MKNFNLYKNYYKSLLISKTRFILTTIGISISFFLILICVLIYDTFSHHIEKTYENFNDDLVVITKDSFSENDRIYFNNNLNGSLLTYYKQTYSTHKIINDTIITTKIHGTNYNFSDNYMYSNDYFGSSLESNPIMEKREMLIGSSWTLDDEINYKSVVVISEFTSRIYYGNKSPIGEKIEIENVYYEIVGVISNSKEENNYIEKRSDDSYFPSLEIYMPQTIFGKNLSDSDYNLLIASGNSNLIKSFSNYYETINQNSNTNLYTRETVDKAIDNSIDTIRPLIFSVAAFLTAISIMFLLNTLFFTSKERIPEFGIRLSLGASQRDILKQIIFEGIVYASISIIISLVLFTILSLIAQIVIVSNVFIIDTLYINFVHLILVIFIMFFSFILLSLIPSLYIRRINLIDAIKFD